jgi:Spy/CpxP family protein refolding chaperone
MRTLLLLAGAAAMAAAMPALAKPGGNGKGGGGGNAHAQHGGGGNARADRGNERRAERRSERRESRGQQRAERREVRQERRQAVRLDSRDDRRAQRVEQRQDRRQDRREMRAERREDRRDFARDNRQNGNRLAARDDRREGRGSADRVRYWREGRALPVQVASGRNCPPGLAKQNAFCLPPGQLRRGNYYGQRVSFDRYRAVPAEWQYRFRDDEDYTYRYDDDGYVYGIGRETGVIGSIFSLFGSGLSLGEPLPIGYDAYNVPMQYRDVYADNDEWMYRYDDNAIYRVNDDNRMIDSVVALLSGNPLSVGQRLPEGYDVYNVPMDYRDQYMDSDEAMYRYSDGGIYQVDPTTQLVQALIEMVV